MRICVSQHPSRLIFLVCYVCFGSLYPLRDTLAVEPSLLLQPGNHIAYIGNTMADRMQHHGWLETYLHALFPRHALTFRNLGFAADQVAERPRSANFGDANQWLTKCKADVVFCFFGYNEALRGPSKLPKFESELTKMIREMRSQQYQGQSPPRLVLFSPIAHENLSSPHLPDGKQNNENLKQYTNAMQRVCSEQGVRFVDLFTTSQALYQRQAQPLTINGIHLTESGNKLFAAEIIHQLFSLPPPKDSGQLTKLRDAVLEKNFYWFNRYRVVDGFNVYGARSKLAWHGQSNADVMRREMEVFDVMTINRDQRVWAIAQGGDLTIADDNLPPLLKVKTNKPGPLQDESFTYLGGEAAIEKMEVADGMQVNLFASEEQFPRLVNPVQMAVDPDSRLWASVWPSYPHWNPTEPRRDALVILPDEDRDGKADACIVFADELNSVTGFEFWGGGVLVAAPPEIWFLKDTDGDDRADVKIRMLQGVSSADIHHTANAMLIGPDGWLYWSRGVFNIANFETPTTTYRSKISGVHRFNPRTFEVELHFPIGPNPHGNVFDRWGFQFANDGTSGKGSYVNIGKGIGNKLWFEKRVRPVAATGILSSSHFPRGNEGNFLICNTIGFLGVLQHKVNIRGADITATEIEPILVSSDENFRPVDLEIGGDGALYIADWHNALIGHMQHNMRDPNRDHEHGRIYRVTYPGRDLLEPPKMKGKPIPAVCEFLFARENSTRYRARLELTGRDSQEVIAAVRAFAARLDPRQDALDRDEAQALLECLWIFAEQRSPDMDLVTKVFQAKEPRVRAAAIRTLGQWGQQVDDWEETLLAAASDSSALVRAEAVKAAVSFSGRMAAEIVFEVASRPLDPELKTVITYADTRLNVPAVIHALVRSDKPLSSAAHNYILAHAPVDDLLRLKPTERVFRAILARHEATPKQLDDALSELATMKRAQKNEILIDLIEQSSKKMGSNLARLGNLLIQKPSASLQKSVNRIRSLAEHGDSAAVRRLGYAGWLKASGSSDPFLTASRQQASLRDFLKAVPTVRLRNSDELFTKIRPLIFALPQNLSNGSDGIDLVQQGVQIDLFYPHTTGVSLKNLAELKPHSRGLSDNFTIRAPKAILRNRFALRFTGLIDIQVSGEYTFYLASDDGSHLYLDRHQVIDNDGPHGIAEKSGSVELSAGLHPISVTYCNHKGDAGLQVAWEGPGFSKQAIPANQLTVANGESLHDVAIAALASIPGHEEEKFSDFASLLAAGRQRPAAIKALSALPQQDWPANLVIPLIDNLVGYLSELPPAQRTGESANAALALAKSLSASLPKDKAAAVEERLKLHNIRVIAIGTVPHRMIYDKERIVVEADEQVEFRFANIDAMPHNFAILRPGALQEVGELAEATSTAPDAMARNYIPESQKVLLASRLLQPGENQTLSFKAPNVPGVYPYVCTYPGHWRRMFGTLYVVKNLEDYQADPQAYLATQELPIQDDLLKTSSRNHEWTFDELISEVRTLPPGRSFEVGKQLFKVASCVGCHRLDNEGYVFGPDLAKLDDKKHTTEYLLRSLIDPSHDIDPKYQAHTFFLDSGLSKMGMIVEKTEKEVKIMVDPLAKGEPTILLTEEIEEQEPSKISPMPSGLLNRLTREEILDLIAFVYARGNSKDKMYSAGQHHHHKH